MKKLRKIFWYAGVEPEDFERCRADVIEDNHKKLKLYLMIAAGFLLFCFCISCGSRVLQPYRVYYGSGFLVIAALETLNHLIPEKKELFLNWLMYAMAAVLYVMGIAMSFVMPQWPSVEFVAFLLATPLMFTMPPIQHIANIAFFEGIFLLLAGRFETGDTLIADLFSVTVFGLLSCVLSTLMMRSNYEKFVAHQQLKEAANYDLLTGVKNRNAFEEERQTLQEKVTLSIGCLYVDANGLHSLNNTQGHGAGDQMLQSVALTMQELFGRKNCYRIGGDEFVAIIRNGQEGTVRNSAVFLKKTMERKGYAVAVGTAVQRVEELDIDEMLRLAEKRMYTDKLEYYRVRKQER